MIINGLETGASYLIPSAITLNGVNVNVTDTQEEKAAQEAENEWQRRESLPTQIPQGDTLPAAPTPAPKPKKKKGEMISQECGYLHCKKMVASIGGKKKYCSSSCKDKARYLRDKNK